jgi:phosphoribosylformylglycinamidine synthase
MIENSIPFTALGHVTKSEIRVDDVSFGFIADLKRTYDNALGEMIVGK